MKKLIAGCIGLLVFYIAQGQVPGVELYNLIKSMVPDSTGYSNVGDWAVGKPKTFAVKWKEDRLIMSPDTSINFYRLGIADITINGKSFAQNGKPVQWNVMLKGPRSGYTNFSILASPAAGLQPKPTIDSVFGKRAYTATLLKSCDTNPITGFNYYEVKMPKKEVFFMKLTWLALNGNTAYRIDCYDDWSRYAVKLLCK